MLQRCCTGADGVLQKGCWDAAEAVHTRSCRGLEVQWFRGSEVQRFRGLEVQRFRGSKVLRFKGTGADIMEVEVLIC